MTNIFAGIFKKPQAPSVSNNLVVGQDELHAENRKNAEAKARNEAILASIGDGVIVVSDKGDILFANQQAQVMLGSTGEHLVGNHLLHAISIFDEKTKLPLDKHPMQVSLLSGQKVSMNLYFMKQDGTKFPVAVTTSPVFLQGSLIGGVLVFRDITHEKDVDRMKTEFISLASHQLRTPLSAMKWYSELLISKDVGELTEEQVGVLNKIYISNERMIDLVNTLLNISRIESGRIIIDPRPTDLKNMVEEILGELAPKLEKKKQKIIISTHPNLPEINVDPNLVRHVYLNLLTNAIKYSATGSEIHIFISKSHDALVSQITDYGIGIPLGQQPKVFQKFFRAANVSRVETDGSGLGLYLVHAIVEASGGSISFKSVEGKGTTFWFSLPLSGSTPKEGEVSINS